MRNTDIKNVIFSNNNATALYWGGSLIWKKESEEIGNYTIKGMWNDSPNSKYNDSPYIIYNNIRVDNIPILDDKTFSYSSEDELTIADNMFVNYTETSTGSTIGYNYNLTSLDLSNLNFSNVTSANAMFRYCVNLSSIIGLDNLKTSSLKKLDNIFSKCSKLTDIDISNWDVSNVNDCSCMFDGCSNIETIKLPIMRMNNGVNGGSASGGMFAECSKLKMIENFNIDYTKSSSYSDFYNCTSLTTITGTPTFNGYSSNPTDLHHSPLTNDSAMVLINGLAEISNNCNIRFSELTYNTLTEEQISTATSKGWSVIK